VVLSGVRVTSLVRTVFDCARALPFPDALGVIDAALRLGWNDHADLLTYCAEHSGCSGSGRALVFCSYGDGLSENGGESFARAQMIRLGFQPPQLQVDFEDPIRKRKSRADYYWETANHKIVWEFHGKQKYLDPEMTQGRSVGEILSAEAKRADRLSLQGVIVNDFDYKDARDLRLMMTMLAEYHVPRRRSARPGRLEYNRTLPRHGARYPRSVRL
jgi:hypothetical protein